MNAAVERRCPVCDRVDWRGQRSPEAAALVAAAGLPPTTCGGCVTLRLAEIGARVILARAAAP